MVVMVTTSRRLTPLALRMMIISSLDMDCRDSSIDIVMVEISPQLQTEIFAAEMRAAGQDSCNLHTATLPIC